MVAEGVEAVRKIQRHKRIVVDVCMLCLAGEGGECHMPGCIFWMDDAPDGRTLELLRKWADE